MNNIDSVQKLSEVTQEHGPLVGITDAAFLLGRSRQGLHQAVREGRLSTFRMRGGLYLPICSMRPGAFALLDEETDKSIAWVVRLFSLSNGQVTHN